jgi:aspartyl aminopeptidase
LDKKEVDDLKDQLFLNKRAGWDDASDDEKREIYEFADDYMYYLNRSKTEKEIIENSKDILLKNGFRDIKELEKVEPGDRVYYINRDRNIYAAVIGENGLQDGLNVVGAHSDSPRLDLKQNPLYENSGLALFKTHYYGGIKKYQWVTIPLAMHALFVKENGERIRATWGEDENESTFVISDILPHLGQDQASRKSNETIKGEELNILVGGNPLGDSKSPDSVKLNIMKILNEKYGITEIDFTSSDIEFVPAMKARSVGFDGSMVGGYGQDDKVCCYTALRGILNVHNPKKTAVCVLTDREEVGFMGVTGMESHAWERFVVELLEKAGQNSLNMVEKVFEKSTVLSADVTAAYDPTFADAFEKRNDAAFGMGVAISKYGGSRGKSGGSEAQAELIAKVRDIFGKVGCKYQSAELGKVDKGGGGTIALTFANRNMDVVDCGVPVMAMHSPYELTHKFDIYQAYKGYEAFYKS